MADFGYVREASISEIAAPGLLKSELQGLSKSAEHGGCMVGATWP